VYWPVAIGLQPLNVETVKSAEFVLIQYTDVRLQSTFLHFLASMKFKMYYVVNV